MNIKQIIDTFSACNNDIDIIIDDIKLNLITNNIVDIRQLYKYENVIVESFDITNNEKITILVHAYRN